MEGAIAEIPSVPSAFSHLKVVSNENRDGPKLVSIDPFL
jgi:hypothetical protein